jgi:hypothetical protein
MLLYSDSPMRPMKAFFLQMKEIQKALQEARLREAELEEQLATVEADARDDDSAAGDEGERPQ